MAAPGTAAGGEFAEPYQKGPDRLCARLRASWLILAGIDQQLAAASPSVRVALDSESLSAAHKQFNENTEILLNRPVKEFLRLQPIRQSLEALEQCDREITPRALRVRAILDRKLQSLLAQVALDLCEPWRIWRGGNHEDEWRDWENRRAAREKDVAALLDRYERWAAKTASNESSLERPREQRLETFRRQSQAVGSFLETELAFRDLARTWLASTEELAKSVRGERAGIVQRAEETLRWIQACPEESSKAPVEGLGLVSPDERVRNWAHRTEKESAASLPERAELVTPGLFPRWRMSKPRATFRSAFNGYAVAPMRKALEQYWSRSAELVREIGHAVEIFDYWREQAPANAAEAEGLFSDARRNAANLLREQLSTLPAPEDLDHELVHAFEVWCKDGLTDLEADQYGWITLLRRPRGRRLLIVRLRSWQRKAQKQIQRAAIWMSARWDRLLEQLGGRIPARPTLPPVVRRTTLRDTLALPASKSDLPGVYHLLFRISPVEDRRFLVGREQELAGLDQALRDWQEERFAACLVIGARGSGKTSLLNCAARDVFAGHSPIRTQLRERALCREAIDCFLRTSLSLEGGADLEAALAAERRILIIEECERIYLRRPGGFEGARYLIHLIQKTAPTTLWVIVMNDRAARVLDAGVQLRRAFSHRINAMSVSREDLETAILERHRLSGLRLRFAPPPAGDPRIGRIRRWIGLHDSPQRLFFDSLFQQSEGVFRSAFELWLSSIERVEGEDVKIRQPLDPVFSRFRSELAQEDQFTLLVIQEHGSLTHAELAEVLCEEQEASHTRLDRLFALGLVAPDPEHPGLRVRPEAQRFVNDMLRRANLT